MKQLFYLALVALTLTGCVSETISKLPESHPASPLARESPQAPATPRLVVGAEELVLPIPTNQTEMQHGQHQPPPAAKGVQQPSEHQHGNEMPKHEENQ